MGSLVAQRMKKTVTLYLNNEGPDRPEPEHCPIRAFHVRLKAWRLITQQNAASDQGLLFAFWIGIAIKRDNNETNQTLLILEMNRSK